jgi:toxin ParE1/3/4
MRIAWTESAVRDLAAARAYIAQDSSPAADSPVGRVMAAVSSLLRVPEIGRTGRRAGTRELVVSRTSYVAVYRLRGDIIEILPVLHGRQRWPDALA